MCNVFLSYSGQKGTISDYIRKSQIVTQQNKTVLASALWKPVWVAKTAGINSGNLKHLYQGCKHALVEGNPKAWNYYWGYGVLTKAGPSMTTLQLIQQVAERVKCTYLHPTNGQKQLNPAVEFRKAEWIYGQHCRRTSSTNYSRCPGSLKPPNRQHTSGH